MTNSDLHQVIIKLIKCHKKYNSKQSDRHWVSVFILLSSSKLLSRHIWSVHVTCLRMKKCNFTDKSNLSGNLLSSDSADKRLIKLILRQQQAVCCDTRVNSAWRLLSPWPCSPASSFSPRRSPGCRGLRGWSSFTSPWQCAASRKVLSRILRFNKIQNKPCNLN